MDKKEMDNIIGALAKCELDAKGLEGLRDRLAVLNDNCRLFGHNNDMCAYCALIKDELMLKVLEIYDSINKAKGYFLRIKQTDEVARNAAAKILLDWIERNGATEFSKREAHNALRKGRLFKKAKDLDAPLRELVERGYIRPITRPHKDPGRPGERYEVNPETTCLEDA